MKNKLQKLLLAVTIILINMTITNAQWTAVASVYGGVIANDGAVSFTIGNKGYVASGSSTDDMYEYDTLANSWTLAGTVPATMGHAFAMSFVINNKAYVVGGDTSGVPLNTVWEFDPSVSVNQWTQKNNFPGGIRDAGFGFAINDAGYVGGGFDGSNLYTDIWKYDAVNDLWSLLPVYLPISGIIFPTSFVIGNNGYILTGGTAPSAVNEITNMWCLDGTNNNLTAKADFAGVGRQAAFAFSNSSYGFVGGGQANYTTNFNDVWRYDEANDQWAQVPNVPLLGAAWSSTFVIGNTAYAGLGAKFVSTGLTGNDVFYKFTMDVPTGINDVNADKITWSFFPNPVSENLHFTGIKNTSVSITVSDALGRILKMENIGYDESIFVGDLLPGVYNVQINEDNRISTRKFIKN